jgi:putative intracellular protease/amidase
VPGEIRSLGGLTALVSQDLDDLVAWSPRVIAVIGGTIWETPDAPDLADLLRTQHGNGVAVGGICAGTLALARTGLLNSTEHTSNNLDFLKDSVADYSGAALYQDVASAVSSGGVISAAGTAPVTFAAAIFEAAGLDPNEVSKLRGILAAEHG